ncbi:MAG: DUF559 domain-containing protein [Luteimonas sp.]|nr:DUF559 domain-containing protein [Luteimonas sp.]
MRPDAKRDVARRLRRSMTDAERRLWFHLRNRACSGWKFRRQHPLGPYIADFACLRAKVVVEVDGGQHLDAASDGVRTRYLGERGFVVLRFWNDDVLLRTEAVLSAIHAVVEARLGGAQARLPRAGKGVG